MCVGVCVWVCMCVCGVCVVCAFMIRGSECVFVARQRTGKDRQ